MIIMPMDPQRSFLLSISLILFISAPAGAEIESAEVMRPLSLRGEIRRLSDRCESAV